MKNIILVVLVSLVLASCADYKSNSLKGYLGDFGDAMVVCERDFWESEIGDSVKMLLTDYVPAMMPAQGQLDLEFCTPNNFKGAAKRFRNVIYLDIGDRQDNQVANIKTTSSEFAIEQLVVYAFAKTNEDMLTLLSERYTDIHHKINDEEIRRKQDLLAYRQDTSAVKSIHLKKDYDIIVPDKYSVLIDSGNVLWMNKLTSTKKEGLDNYKVKDIVVFTYDYDSEEVFELENIIARRDEVLKKLTYNSDDSTYVRFQEKLDPKMRLIESGKDYKVEVRSLWTKEGAYEGGPSIQYVQLDYENRRVIHADARVYAPGTTSKREVMRELEALVKSVKPLNQNNEGS